MDKNQNPMVSIILAVRNEEKFIQRTLQSILAQDYPKEKIEILVADGMSGDNTPRIVRAIFDQHPSRKLFLLNNEKKIASNAFNLGVQHSSGDIFIIVGGHSEIAPDYVRRCVEALEESGADCVGGVLEHYGETFEAEAIAKAQASPFGTGNVAFRAGNRGKGYTDTAVFAAYKKEVVNRIGLFDEEFVRNQDDEFNYRLAHHGGKIWFDPSIRGVYYSRSSFKALAAQYFQYGYWKVRVLQKHPKQMQPRHFAPPVFAALFGSLAILSFLSGAAGELFLLLLLSYGAANLAASVITAAGKWKLIPLLSLTYGILHFSYGAGFLSGLIAFRDRWKKELS